MDMEWVWNGYRMDTHGLSSHKTMGFYFAPLDGAGEAKTGPSPKGTAPGSTGCTQRNKHILFSAPHSLGSDKKALPMLQVST